jgi:hypothetical protein
MPRLEALEQLYFREAERVFRYDALVDGERFQARLDTDELGRVLLYEGLWEAETRITGLRARLTGGTMQKRAPAARGPFSGGLRLLPPTACRRRRCPRGARGRGRRTLHDSPRRSTRYG